MSLTKEQCEIILQNRFNNPDIKYICYDLKPFSENAEGYGGEHYKLVIDYELNGKTCSEILFMKQKPKNDLFAKEEEYGSAKVYEKEILVYDFFLKEFEKCGFDVSFASKSFYCIPNDAIIMEHKISQDYTLVERQTMFNMNKIQCALKSLALFHGAGIAYEKYKSKELGKPYTMLDTHKKLLEEIFFCQHVNRNDFTLEFWDSALKTIFALIDLLPNKTEQYKKELTELVKNFDQGKIFAEETGLAKCIGHGDLWSNNMLFKLEGDKVVHCCLVDFQILRYFYPAFDVTLAIYCNTSTEFREQHLDDMIQYYFNTLSEILNNYNCSIHEVMTLEEFYRSMDLVKADCLMQVAFTNTIICIPKEILTDVMKDKEKGMENLMYNNTDNAVRAFNKSELFRTIMVENMDEIYRTLSSANKKDCCPLNNNTI